MCKGAKMVGRGLLAASLVGALGVGGVAASSGSVAASSGSVGRTAKTGAVTELEGLAPDYLDPQLGYTTQAANADWLAYTATTGAPGS